MRWSDDIGVTNYWNKAVILRNRYDELMEQQPLCDMCRNVECPKTRRGVTRCYDLGAAVIIQ